jgi:hypothetical protein
VSEVGGEKQGWRPDPFGRHELRYFDDGAWTDSVTTNGRRRRDPPGGEHRVPTIETTPEAIRRQVAAAGAAMAVPCGGTLLTEPVLVFSTAVRTGSKGSTEFAIYRADGGQVGAIREVGQTRAKAIWSFVEISVLRARNLQLVDMSGAPEITVKRPLTVSGTVLRAKYLIGDGVGRPVGVFAQQVNYDFSLSWPEGMGASMKQTKPRSGAFVVRDQTGDVVARLTRGRGDGARLSGLFTGTRHYVLEVVAPVPDPLRRLLLAAPAVIDVTERYVDTMAD